VHGVIQAAGEAAFLLLLLMLKAISGRHGINAFARTKSKA
jgi:hypothetical protein